MFDNRANDERIRTKQELRLQIGRQRRRIDARLRELGGDVRQLTSWRRHLADYPGVSAAVALGAGLAASSLMWPSRFTRWLGTTLVRETFRSVQDRLWNEWRKNWSEK